MRLGVPRFGLDASRRAQMCLLRFSYNRERKARRRCFGTLCKLLGIRHDNTSSVQDTYPGEFNFLALKDWVNLHSESGMGLALSRAKPRFLLRPDRILT